MRWKGAALAVALLAVAALAGAANLNMHEVAITTTSTGDGSATGYAGPLNGYIIAWQYIHDSYDANFDATMETATTGILLREMSNHAAAGSHGLMRPVAIWATEATVYALGDKGAYGAWPVANELIKISVADAGTPNTGIFRVWSEGAR